MRGRGYAHALRKRELHLVVHMVLPTKEDHLVLQHRLIDGTRGCGVHLPEAHSVDAGADVLAQLHDPQIAVHDPFLPSDKIRCSQLTTLWSSATVHT